MSVTLLLGLATAASADDNIIVGRFGYHFSGRAQAQQAPSAADTHILFINPCTGGCTVHVGNPDNRTDTSDIPQSTSQLQQFSQSATVWNAVKSCLQDTFSRFNVTVTDVDPGQTPHMEVMTAGIGAELGLPEGVLGIADFPCQGVGNCDSFMSNALVFAFANDPYYTNDPDNICSTVAQEIAHTWALDHVVDASDPMTYNAYSGIRQYHDNEKCGSDCQNGQSPFGLPCTGSGGQATHTCTGTGQATQSEVSTITALFGTSAPDTTPPTVMITAPANNASVMPGTAVTANVTDNIGVASAVLDIDGVAQSTLNGAPFSWTLPQSLTQGTHMIEVVGTDLSGNTGSAMISVTYGHACTKDSDCTTAGDICQGGHCVAGPTTNGGLGSPCNANSDCMSGQCADDGTHKYCVDTCNPTSSDCPGGFSCMMVGTGGVCWPGADNGGGGCNSGDASGLMLLGLGLGVLVWKRRR
ncbi:MAG TPA: Ig-like domain-containing protein [Kofleriaceae bacterium]|nr:Ig-like domain-containing protein [Kofleriaceae bacterium]